MVEAVAKLVLDRLADAAIQETLFLYGAGDKLDSLQHELQWIQAFLKDAESKRNTNEGVKTWVSQVQEAAYRIEDVIDTFVAEFGEGNVNALKRILQKYLMKLPIFRRLTSEMGKIQTRLREIKECTDKYGINRQLGDSSSSAVPRRPVREFILPDEDDPDVVGLHKDKEKIVELLTDPNNKSRRVVSIVGQGGLGKTTLARKVYNSDEVKREFEFRLWLSISQQFKLIHLLKTMLENNRSLKEDEKALLQKEDEPSLRSAEEYFIKELSKSLKEKRYMIVMDDVWTENLWSQVMTALPDVKNGSRVLVTTRFCDIARKADPTCDPYNLCYLSEEESQKLLLKKAFSDQDHKAYPLELSDLCKRFAKRCGGLPLALKVVGGLLSRQPLIYQSWHKIFEKFSWHDDEGNKCTEILATSYENLPFVLKPCFMYFASYSEDYKIKAKPLIRMWVAEGFIPKEDSTTMEETAEDYLEELVQRSMIQVSERDYNGSIKYCYIHDLLRDLAIEKAKENRFLEIISNQGGNYSSSTVTVRRATLHCNHEDIMKNTGRNLRSLLLFGDNVANVERFRLLKIFSGWDIKFVERIKGDMFKELAQLRYITLPMCGGLHPHFRSIWWAEKQFWKNISRMRNLQTLDIRFMNLSNNVLDCIWDIKTLRHVILPPDIYGPPSIAELPNLQTLKYLRVRKEWVVKGWPTMPNIQVLKLRNFLSDYVESFTTFLSGLHHLTSLCIYVGIPCDYEMMDMSIFPWYNQLQSLNVTGKWTASKAEAKAFPIHLTKLRLEGSKIKEDPMPVLEKLENLRELGLSENAYVGRQLYCSAGGFPRLQSLSIDLLSQLEEWKADLEEGAMPVLKEISLFECRQLRLIPGLHYMTSLNKLVLHYGSPDLHRSLREDESHKIRDGQFVDLRI